MRFNREAQTGPDPDGSAPAASTADASWAPRLKWGLLGLALLAAVWLPFAVSSFWVNLATQALFFGLFALAINLISGYGGMITLGQAGMLGVAGYGLGILTVDQGWSLGAAVGAALVAAAVASAFFGILAVRTRGTYFVMITLAEGMVVWGIAQRWQELTGGENGITGIPKPDFATEYWEFYYLVLAVVAVCVVLLARLVRSPFGLSLKGIREGEDRLASLGYNVTLHKLLAFTISGTLAGVAGVLLAMHNNFIGPSDVFFLASADGLLMAILGGIGTLSGPLVGAAIVVFIQNEVSTLVDRWQTILGVVFVVVILFAPGGIVGTWTRTVWVALLRRLGAPREAAKAETAATGAGPTVGGARSAPVRSAAEERPAERAVQAGSRQEEG
jgi:branched-chain amino acid transport system permease protein